MPRPIAIHLPSLVGTKEFIPTIIMVQTLTSYLQLLDKNEVIAPYQILTRNGHCAANWYKWIKKSGFLAWWHQASSEYHKNLGLPKVHNAIYRRALDQSPQDAKMYLERFDRDYKPATAQEHSFKGIEPPEQLDGAVERSRQRAEGRKQVESEVIEGADNAV